LRLACRSPVSGPKTGQIADFAEPGLCRSVRHSLSI
jgi:hypothetical protein